MSLSSAAFPAHADVTLCAAPTERKKNPSLSASPAFSCAPSAASLTDPAPPSSNDRSSKSALSYSKEYNSISVPRAYTFFSMPLALFVLCGALLSSCVCVLLCPSFLPALYSSKLGVRSTLTRLYEWQYSYFERPAAGTHAARILAAPILVSSALYLPAIFSLQYWMRNRPAFHLKTACVLWNLLLSSLSLIGFVVILVSQPTLLGRPVVPEAEFTPAVRAVICIFTLTKTIEYGDTVILALKKKPLIFLHLYHHLTVTVYCWHAQLVRVSVGHYFAFINLGIHTWMYLYYALAATYPRHPVLRCCRPLITVSQILQMCTGLSLATYALTQNLPAEERPNAAVAVAMYISYACLFVHFFFSTYIRQPSQSPPKARSSFISSTPVQLLVLVHLLAVAGLYFLFTHKRRNTLVLEILSFSAATAAVLQLVIRTHRRENSNSDGKRGTHLHSGFIASTSYNNNTSYSRGDYSYNSSGRFTQGTSSSCLQGSALDDARNIESCGKRCKDRRRSVTHVQADAYSLNNFGSPNCCNSSSGLFLSAFNDVPSHDKVSFLSPVPAKLGSTGAESLQWWNSMTSKVNTTCEASRMHAEPHVCTMPSSDDISAAAKKETIRDATLTCGGGASGKRDRPPRQQLEINCVVAGSLLPSVQEQPQHSNKSDSTSSISDRGSSDSTRSTDSCSHLCSNGGRGTAAAQQENLQRLAAAQPVWGLSSKDETEGARMGGRPDAPRKGVLHAIINKIAFSIYSRTNSGNDSYPDTSSSHAKKCSNISKKYSTEALPGGVAVVHSSSYAQTTIQTGSRTLLAVSNFVLACVVRWLADPLEVGAAGAGARKTSAGVSCSRQGVVSDKVPSTKVVYEGAVDGRPNGVTRETALLAAGGDNNTKHEQRAAVKQQEEVLEGGEQERQRGMKKTEACGLLELCRSSNVLSLKAQLRQQQYLAVPPAERMTENPFQISQTDVFCEENSSTVCSSPEYLGSRGLCSKATAEKDTPGRAAGLESPMGTVETTAPITTLEESPGSTKDCFYVSSASLEQIGSSSPENNVHGEASDAMTSLHGRDQEKQSTDTEVLLRKRAVVADASSACHIVSQAGSPATATYADTAEIDLCGTEKKSAATPVAQQAQRIIGQLQGQQLQGTSKPRKEEAVAMSISTAFREGGSSNMTALDKSSREGIEMLQGNTQEEEKKHKGFFVVARQLLLAAACAALPAFYGWLIHGNALLGLCVHGALRWLLELYTSVTLYSSRGRRAFGALLKRDAPAGEKPIKQRCL